MLDNNTVTGRENVLENYYVIFKLVVKIEWIFLVEGGGRGEFIGILY